LRHAIHNPPGEAGCAGCEQQPRCLAGRFDEARREQLVSRLRTGIRCLPRYPLFHAGDRFRYLYIVQSGSFKSWRLERNGDQQVLGFHLPGDVLGIDGIRNGTHTSAAQALQSSRVCALSLARNPESLDGLSWFNAGLLKAMSRASSQDQEHLVIMGRRQATQRLAMFLRRLRRQYRRLGWPDDELTLTMSRADLASFLGLVLETVSRLFSQLHESQVLEVRRRRVTVLDPERLRQLSEAEAVSG